MLLQQARNLYKSVEQRMARREMERLRDAVPLAHEKMGTDYGGWFVPSGLLTSRSLCYGVGAGEDISFEIGLVRRYGCEVFCFDPTPRAQRHVERLRNNTERGNPTEINNRTGKFYDCNQSCLDRLHFHPYGLWSEDRVMRFYSPADPTHVSHSIVNLQRTGTFFEAECKTIKSLTQAFGHTELSLLKLDVEGAEYEILASMLDEGVRPAILCVEFDEGFQPADDQYLARIRGNVVRLKENHYLLTHTDGWNATFVHKPALEPKSKEFAI